MFINERVLVVNYVIESWRGVINRNFGFLQDLVSNVFVSYWCWMNIENYRGGDRERIKDKSFIDI